MHARVGATTLSVRGVPLADPLPAVNLTSLVLPGASAGALAGAYVATLTGPQGSACRPGPRPQPYAWTLSFVPAGSAGAAAQPQPVTDLDLYYGEPIKVAAAALGGPGGCGGAPRLGGAPPLAPAPKLAPAPPPIGRVAPMAKAPPPMARVAPIPPVAKWGRRRSHLRRRALAAVAAPTPAPRRVAQPATDGGAAGAPLGPELAAMVVLPVPGVHVLVGQVVRGQELILMPFYVNCSGVPQPRAL